MVLCQLYVLNMHMNKSFAFSPYIMVELPHENIPIKFEPLKTHFYIVKLGFTEVYIMFLISALNIDCGLVEAVLTSTHNLCFEQEHFFFYLKTFIFWSSNMR